MNSRYRVDRSCLSAPDSTNVDEGVGLRCVQCGTDRDLQARMARATTLQPVDYCMTLSSPCAGPSNIEETRKQRWLKHVKGMAHILSLAAAGQSLGWWG